MATGDSTHPGPAGPLTVEALTDDDTGRWQITTHTSVYLLDLDRRLITRIPGAAHEHGINPANDVIWVVNTYDSDRTPQPLAELVQCVLGARMLYLWDLDPGWVIPGASTPVREIRRTRHPTTRRAARHE